MKKKTSIILVILIALMTHEMMCITPITLKQKDGTIVNVPCGKCYECTSNKRDAWTFRLMNELSNCDSAIFVTLTYNDENLKKLNKDDVQLFMKRLRYENGKVIKKGKPVKYYLTAEYGGQTKRPHYHAVIYNLSEVVVEKLINGKIWNMGHIDLIPVGIGNIHYLNTFHVIGKFDDDPEIPPFNMMSKGLGKCYIDKSGSYHKRNGDLMYKMNGFTKKLPRYYAEKLFSPERRKALALQLSEESIKAQNEFDDKCKKIGVNPFKQKWIIREQKRKIFINKCKKTQKL